VTVFSGVLIVDDAMTDPLAEVGKALGDEGIEVLRLSDFVRREGFDFDPEAADLRRLRTSGSAEPEQRRVLDRVVTVSTMSLSQFDGGERLLRPGQLSFAYETLLGEIGCAPDAGAAYSTVGKVLPLPTQWRLVSQNLPELAVPAYKHGYGPEMVPADDFEKPIFKSPFDLYSWKTNERPDEVVWDQFIVEAPGGTPVLSYFLGSNAIVSSLRAEVELEPESAARLSNLTLEIGRLFRAQVGEILWFVEGDKVVFAAFSHLLAAARRHGQFAEAAEGYLREFFSTEAG
jgi:hypothetical protein